MSRQLSRPEACEAVLSWRYLHDLAHALPSQRAGRPRQHPLALHLAWAALARVHGSGNRLDVETRDRSTWRRYVDIYNRGARAHPRGQPVDRWCDRLTSDTYRHTREPRYGTGSPSVRSNKHRNLGSSPTVPAGH